jgi:hypothetical protein
MEQVDKLTLELLMNKNTYNRYIEKTDPSKHKEEQQFREKVKKYKSRMISLTTRHLNDPTFQISNELTNAISEYARTFIKYFEMNDLEVSEFSNNEYVGAGAGAESEDMLFGSIDSCSDEDEEDDKNKNYNNDDSLTTEQANKMLYRYTLDNYVKRK